LILHRNEFGAPTEIRFAL